MDRGNPAGRLPGDPGVTKRDFGNSKEHALDS